jgi:flagellin
MIIQSNISALNAHRMLGANNAHVSKNIEKLSSGYRINRAGDDAAGLAISEKMRAQIRGLAVAYDNTGNAISLIQTAEGGLTEIHAILQRMHELALQSSNGIYQDMDRSQLELEYQEIMSEIDRIAHGTRFNNVNLLNGRLAEKAGGPVFDYAAGHSGWIGGAMTVAAGENIDFASVDFRLQSGPITEFSVMIRTFDLTGNLPGLTLATPWDVFSIDMNTPAGTIQEHFTDFGYIGLRHGTIGGNERYFQISFYVMLDSGLSPREAETEGVWTVSFDNSGGGADSAAFEFYIESASQITSTATRTLASGINFQIGTDSSAHQRVTLNIPNMDSKGIGHPPINTTGIVGIGAARSAIASVKSAINFVSGVRTELGAMQNRLEHTRNNLKVTFENLTSAESAIRDTDMAKEMMEFTKNQILVQAAQTMLTQANQQPQGVLSLLR